MRGHLSDAELEAHVRDKEGSGPVDVALHLTACAQCQASVAFERRMRVAFDPAPPLQVEALATDPLFQRIVGELEKKAVVDERPHDALERHPSDVELEAFSIAEANGKDSTIAAHVARCARCKSAIAFDQKMSGVFVPKGAMGHGEILNDPLFQRILHELDEIVQVPELVKAAKSPAFGGEHDEAESGLLMSYASIGPDVATVQPIHRPRASDVTKGRRRRLILVGLPATGLIAAGITAVLLARREPILSLPTRAEPLAVAAGPSRDPASVGPPSPPAKTSAGNSRTVEQETGDKRRVRESSDKFPGVVGANPEIATSPVRTDSMQRSSDLALQQRKRRTNESATVSRIRAEPIAPVAQATPSVPLPPVDRILAPRPAAIITQVSSHEAAPVLTADRYALELGALRRVMLQSIAFDSLSSSLHKRRARDLLDAKITIMRRNQAVRVRVYGHATERATDRANFRLGLSRAESVRRYFVEHGIESERIEIASWVSRRPDSVRATASALRLFGGVQFEIIAGGG